MAKKKAVGSLKNGRESKSKRLGIKKYGGNVVRAGNIIIRQRGTKYYPGINTRIGKDHTIFSVCEGFVSFKNNGKKRIINVTKF